MRRESTSPVLAFTMVTAWAVVQLVWLGWLPSSLVHRAPLLPPLSSLPPTETTRSAARRSSATSPPTSPPPPLPAGEARLYERTLRTPVVLTRGRLAQLTPISCGGTPTVLFKSWAAMADSTPGLDAALPVEEPALAGCSDAARGCVRTTWTPGAIRLERCAVVGNSGTLRDTHHGAAIDAADVVVRFNGGRASGFEAHVGHRSDVRLYNGPYVEPKMSGEATVAQLRDPATRAWLKQRRAHPSAEAFLIDPELLCLAHEWVDHLGDKPSSGMVGVLAALTLCRHVDLYGFNSVDYYNRSAWSHYYDHERPKPGREKAHPFEREREVYDVLQRSGLLTVHA